MVFLSIITAFLATWSKEEKRHKIMEARMFNLECRMIEAEHKMLDAIADNIEERLMEVDIDTSDYQERLELIRESLKDEYGI